MPVASAMALLNALSSIVPVLTNDKYPSAVGDWTLVETTIKKGAAIGANATILPHLNIGDGSFIGAGSVVTKNIKKNEIVKGNPAKKIRSTSHKIDLSPFKK